MKKLTKYFLAGLLTLLPFGLTIYVFAIFILWSESLTRALAQYFLADFYVPGLGIVLAVSVVVLLGFVVSQPLLKRMLSFVELPFKSVPLIRNIYSASKNLSDYFNSKKDGPAKHVVMVKYPGADVEIIGFLTRESLDDTGLSGLSQDKVAVYFPLSYQIGGYTCFIPRAWTRKLDISVESAMGQTLTAWMPIKHD